MSEQWGSAASEVDERDSLVRVAWYYFKDGLTQAEIGERLAVSRPTVARMIQRAKDLGIVRIEINPDDLATLELSRRLRERYGLRDALVVPGLGEPHDYAQANQRLAFAGAQYLRRHLRPGATIGFGWGDTVLRTLLALSRESLKGVTFVTVAGGIDAYTGRAISAASNGFMEQVRLLPAPLMASAVHIARALRQESSVTSVLRLAGSTDATLIGIGSVRSDATIVEHGVVLPEQLEAYRAAGAVGDMLGEWFDARGEVVPSALHELRIGIAIKDLRDMRNVIGVAGGAAKAPAIAGALAGRYLDVLVTSEDAARALVERPPS